MRVAALIGGIATALAGVVKLFSVRQDLFWIILIGQTIGSTAQVFVMPLPTKIAAVWFKPNEVNIFFLQKIIYKFNEFFENQTFIINNIRFIHHTYRCIFFFTLALISVNSYFIYSMSFFDFYTRR